MASDWRLAAAFGGAAGLAVSPFWDSDGGWLKPTVAFALVTVVVIERGRVGPAGLALIAVAAVLAGTLVGSARLDSIDSGAFHGPRGPVTFKGFVTGSPSESRGTARFGFETPGGKLLVEAASQAAGSLVTGDGIEVEGEVGGTPDWQRADLRRRGIAMVLRAEGIRPSGEVRGGIAGFIDQLRRRALEALSRAVPERVAALSRGFVLGDDSDIDARTTADFRNSGLAHLLAVSGQNIILLSLLAIPFLSLLGVGPRARLVWIGALILVYMPLAGGGPSIQRAGVMGIAGLVAIAATRSPSRAYALALAALITLGLNPRATGDIGWQLSFAAVVGIMLMARPFQLRLEELFGSGGWRRALSEAIAVTLAATVATAPLAAFHFEQLPVGTLIANLAAMPAVAPAMWMGMISIAAGQITPTLAVPFNLVGSACLAWIAQVAAWFGRPDWAVVEVSIGGVSELALVSVLSSVAVVGLLRAWKGGPASPRSARAAIPVLFGLAAILLLLPGLTGNDRRSLDPPPEGGARVEVLDVGQGDAILVRPSGANPVLIDGGPPGGGLAGALDSASVERLAAVILTHPDLDHYGGLLDIFGLVEVDRLLYVKSPPELLALAHDSGTTASQISMGDSIDDGNVTLEILWPPAGDGPLQDPGEGAETNQRSIVALLEWRQFRMLLTGDAEAEAVPMDPGPIDVLKVSHHGSEDTGLPELLERTSPRLAVIPVGEDNSFGHPVPAVLTELAGEGIETLRTDHDGTVSIVLQDQNWTIETGD